MQKLLGTPFQIKVWNYLMKIPKGKVLTYKEVAKAIGKPKSYRAVANAIGKNPYPPKIPCHRVVRFDGGIGGSSSGDSIEITLKPNSVDAPLLFKVFGDNEIFSGKLDIAEITINNPKR